MAEKKQMILNRLPAPTWNWLRVNRTVLDWENENEIDLGAVVPQRAGQGKRAAAPWNPQRGRIQPQGRGRDGRARQRGHDHRNLRRGAEPARAHAPDRAPQTRRSVWCRSRTRRKALVSSAPWRANCEEGGRIELYQVLAGKGDVYGDSKIELNGDGASFEAETGYLARKQQKVDINLVVNHRGKRTECEINAAGALMDAASKIFRGTIDFKRGASDSVGNEKETVLMLGDDVVNQHRSAHPLRGGERGRQPRRDASASLDDETLFYFESRGIGRDVAEKHAGQGLDRARWRA